MPLSANALQYTGRYNGPVPTSNLGSFEHDLPEFEPFDDIVTPRGNAPAGVPLSVQSIDMCQQINKPKHYTTAYDIQNLVVRRGQQFIMQVTFSRPLTTEDDFQLEFVIGSDPSASRGSLVVVTFGVRPGGPWSGQILELRGESVTLGVTPTANSIVGKFRTYVAIVMDSGLQRTKRDASTDLYLLFNAWCPDDAVFFSDEAGRTEYVLNDSGVIFQGSVGAVTQRPWMYGQFERGVLDACIYILDVSEMPIDDRGNIIKMVRIGSAMINAEDDNGVCVCNWSNDFSMGIAPTSWTGSVKILLQYANTGVPVSYAQCWVFAGVFNTFLRCLGIPARVITNFNSAHDNAGSLTTNIIFRLDGTSDTRNTTDSIWNFHCWNEVFTMRQDLPPGLGGWQVVDSTPQQTSDGYYRCGPTSVAAIKEGLLCHQFDSLFVFAEVNSDVVFYKRDRYGTLTPYKVDKTCVGKAVYTKSIGSNTHEDITHTYKYPEGSEEDARTMARAEEYGCEMDHTETLDTQLSVVINNKQVMLGQDISLEVDFQNKGYLPKTVKANLAGSVIFYTGVLSNHFKNHNFTVTVPASQTERVMLKVKAQEYMFQLDAQISLKIVVTAQADDQSVIASKVINLQTPTLTMTVSGRPQLQQQMFVNVSFTNPFNFPLLKANLTMEGPGLMSVRTQQYSVINPQASISWKESFIPRLDGPRRLVAVMDCSNLRQVTGVADVVIMA